MQRLLHLQYELSPSSAYRFHLEKEYNLNCHLRLGVCTEYCALKKIRIVHFYLFCRDSYHFMVFCFWVAVIGCVNINRTLFSSVNILSIPINVYSGCEENKRMWHFMNLCFPPLCDVHASSYLLSHRHPLSFKSQFSALHLASISIRLCVIPWTLYKPSYCYNYHIVT